MPLPGGFLLNVPLDSLVEQTLAKSVAIFALVDEFIEMSAI